MKLFAAILASAFLTYAPAAMSCGCSGKKDAACECAGKECAKDKCDHKKTCSGKNSCAHEDHAEHAESKDASAPAAKK